MERVPVGACGDVLWSKQVRPKEKDYEDEIEEPGVGNHPERIGGPERGRGDGGLQERASFCAKYNNACAKYNDADDRWNHEPRWNH
jgi:hypothetical protein